MEPGDPKAQSIFLKSHHAVSKSELHLIPVHKQFDSDD